MKRAEIVEQARAAAQETAPLAPEDRPSSPNAYQSILDLKKELELIVKKAKKADNEWLMLQGVSQLRQTIETMLKIWETQKRIESQYNTETPLSASLIYKFLRERYPKVLKELVAYLKEANQG